MMMRTLTALLVAILGAVVAHPSTAARGALSEVVAQAQAPAAPSGFGVRPVLDNATVNIVRLLMTPGAREQPHTHAYAMLVVWLSRGDVEMLNGASSAKRTTQTGEVEFVPAGTTHAAANIGTAPFEVVVIAIRPDRVRAGTAPPVPFPENITRTPVLDTPDAAVTRVELVPSAREPVHTHPYDLILVVMTPGRVELLVGKNKETKAYAVGDVIFVPRNETHSAANVGAEKFAVTGVAIK